MILSQWAIELVRWEIINTSGLFFKVFKAFLKFKSVKKSNAEALSSKITILGLPTKAPGYLVLLFFYLIKYLY